MRDNLISAMNKMEILHTYIHQPFSKMLQVENKELKYGTNYIFITVNLYYIPKLAFSFYSLKLKFDM